MLQLAILKTNVDHSLIVKKVFSITKYLIFYSVRLPWKPKQTTQALEYLPGSKLKRYMNRSQKVMS